MIKKHGEEAFEATIEAALLRQGAYAIPNSYYSLEHSIFTDEADDVMALFVQLVFHTYNDDSYGHAPISPAIFVLEDGVIQSVLIPTEKPATSSPALKPKPWWKFWR